MDPFHGSFAIVGADPIPPDSVARSAMLLAVAIDIAPTVRIEAAHRARALREREYPQPRAYRRALIVRRWKFQFPTFPRRNRARSHAHRAPLSSGALAPRNLRERKPRPLNSIPPRAPRSRFTASIYRPAPRLMGAL